MVRHVKGQKSPEVITIFEGQVKRFETLVDLGLRHSEQIEILQRIPDQILKMQAPQIASQVIHCPQCGHKLNKSGYKPSEFNAVFTDNQVAVQRKRGRNCNWHHTPSIRSEFGTAMHHDLAKMQCEVGAEHTYREAQSILNMKSCHDRRVNNHERILQVVQAVGEYITHTPPHEEVVVPHGASELIVQVDGGHIKDKTEASRTFEAMTAMVYRPDSIRRVEGDCRGEIFSKNCAASALADGQSYMSAATLVAAKKQSMTGETHLTALCDGAHNCWTIIDKLAPYCRGVTRILDWFHVSMKFHNIAVADDLKKLYEKAKWHLWHGRVETAMIRLDQVIESSAYTIVPYTAG